MSLKIKIDFDENSISNLAFIKALLIIKNIEKLDLSYEDKKKVKNLVIEKLKKLDK